MDTNKTINEITELIINETKLAGRPLTKNDFYVIHQPLGHHPLSLPTGKMAVYTFVYKDEFFKIGQVNSKSNARYQSQHYNENSCNSNLAKSLHSDETMQGIIDLDNLSQWIKDNFERFDVILYEDLGKVTLNFIEGLLQYKYKPRYEG